MVMGCLTGILAFSAMADDPVISQVTVRQRWPWSRLVDIDYVLTCDETQRVDVVLSANDGSTSLALPPKSLTGDLYGVSHGVRRIVWDPMKTAYTNSHLITQFSVTLVQTPPPVYMIVDLTKNAGADGQIEYIYPGDERLETYGRFTNVWFGVTNDSVYATTKLVLRRIHAGTFGMSDSAISTTLTKDFYTGVFEVTQRQWELITGARPSYFNNSTYYASRPVEQVSYEDVRGSTNGSPVINWPMTGHMVATNSFIGKLRDKTGIDGFDLPTAAQSEYACRAETTTVFNDGNPDANFLGANAVSNIWLDVLGRYMWNGGLIDGVTSPGRGGSPVNGTATVGSYRPNAWGLYDMHGNLYKWCLDWYVASLGTESKTDPLGPVSGTERETRGGRWSGGPSACSSSYRGHHDPLQKNFNSVGLRVVIHLP